jgi:hypothetical protein
MAGPILTRDTVSFSQWSVAAMMRVGRRTFVLPAPDHLVWIEGVRRA